MSEAETREIELALLRRMAGLSKDGSRFTAPICWSLPDGTFQWQDEGSCSRRHGDSPEGLLDYINCSQPAVVRTELQVEIDEERAGEQESEAA